MNASILYMNSDESALNDLRSRFVLKENIEIKTAATAFDGIALIKERDSDISLLIIDKCIEDMSLSECVKYISLNYPKIAIIVCIDENDVQAIDGFANNPSVVRIYLSGYDADELVDDAMYELEYNQADVQYRDSIDRMIAEGAELEKTVESLKDILNRQRFSFGKFDSIITPALEAAIHVDMENGGHNEVFYDFLRQSCKKLLTTMTTTRLSSEMMGRYLCDEICEVYASYENTVVKEGDIVCCIEGNAGRSELARIAYCIYVAALFEKYMWSNISGINLRSGYIDSTKCEFRLTAVNCKDEQNADCIDSINEYINAIMDSYACSYRVDLTGPNRTHCFTFEI